MNAVARFGAHSGARVPKVTVLKQLSGTAAGAETNRSGALGTKDNDEPAGQCQVSRLGRFDHR